MSERRWASRSLVKMLIFELHNYKSAAEVVSGSEDTFNLYSQKLGEMIEAMKENPEAVQAITLQEFLGTVREDITNHQDWQREVLDNLPRVDDEEGMTGPLRQAFAKSSAARAQLLQEVMEAEEQWHKVQTTAFERNQNTSEDS